MGIFAVLNHLFNLVLPALAMALILPSLARLLWWRAWAGVSWWAVVKRVALVGVAVLLAGLLLLGRDGAMLTYAALVVSSAMVVWMMVFK
jgi:hypothetical protein